MLIADDEPAARRGVRQLLAPYPEFTVVGECRDGAEVLKSLDRLRPHVVFLDIQMPGMDGFEVLRRRRPQRMPAFVFLTAYGEFALRAFDAEARDYLLKPVTEARFAETIGRLRRELLVERQPAEEAVIIVTTARGAVVLPLREIEWIEAADNYARIWTGSADYLLRESLRDLEQRTGAKGFARAHRRALVRLGAVRRIVDDEAGGLKAIVRSGAAVPVARRRRRAFLAALRAEAGEAR